LGNNKNGFFGLFRRNQNDVQVYPIEEIPTDENNGLEGVQKMLNGIFDSKRDARKKGIGEKLVIENIEDLRVKNIEPSLIVISKQGLELQKNNQKSNNVVRYNF